ncbi:hypothetical protein HYH03_012532 [Edaphochlamys debaryana]|uniref:Uncharacterized protein n=1 Tax=Edaphochlamys debaryana TaxID=47281 RepID=A0A835XSL0_9CHLO|nr:hypothetical protein HYH03_012532 [Edaphochlamys debaryana]|eukprot:KAG2488902.1 hypothetical protein HYH03_012532 [Edaphochlamys debaryana]
MDAEEEYLAEPFLRDQFLINYPTRDYSYVLNRLPRVFVGPPEGMVPIVELMCELLEESFWLARLALPPWRTEDAMLSKWLPEERLLRDTHVLPRPAQRPRPQQAARGAALLSPMAPAPPPRPPPPAPTAEPAPACRLDEAPCAPAATPVVSQPTARSTGSPFGASPFRVSGSGSGSTSGSGPGSEPSATGDPAEEEPLTQLDSSGSDSSDVTAIGGGGSLGTSPTCVLPMSSLDGGGRRSVGGGKCGGGAWAKGDAPAAFGGDDGDGDDNWSYSVGGFSGGSYRATDQLAAAAVQPPPLRCVVSFLAPPLLPSAAACPLAGCSGSSGPPSPDSGAPAAASPSTGGGPEDCTSTSCGEPQKICARAGRRPLCAGLLSVKLKAAAAEAAAAADAATATAGSSCGSSSAGGACIAAAAAPVAAAAATTACGGGGACRGHGVSRAAAAIGHGPLGLLTQHVAASNEYDTCTSCDERYVQPYLPSWYR